MTRQIICITLTLTVFICFTHCSTSRSGQLKKDYEATYINQFKLTYFRQLLRKSYNHSAAVQEIINADHSGFTEPILNSEDYALIDSLTTVDNEKMKIDSLNGNRRAEGSQGKRPLGYIQNTLTGKWLDSLAKRRLKRTGIPASWTE